jgi:NAD-dependent DNA ligase
MNSPEVKSTVNAYINKQSINGLIPYFEEDLQNIMMIINIAQFIYNDSGCSTGLTDSNYDTLYAIMLANGGADIVSVPVLAEHSSKTVFHKYPALRGTLTKIFYLTQDEERKNQSRRYLDEWKATMEAKIFERSGKRIDLDNQEIYVFPKYDGVSGIFEYNADGTLDRVLTRGFTQTNEAEDITHVFSHIMKRRDPERKNVPYGLKTEIMMLNDSLKYYNETYHTDYKNTRSIVSAIINSDEFDVSKSKLLTVVPLRVGYGDGGQDLAKEVFTDYPYIRCRLKDRERIREFALAHAYVDGLRCDGAVIYIIDPEIQRILGRENDKNNYEVAYKFTEESAMTTLKSVTFNVGLFGRIAPVAHVEPVKLKGNTIDNVSLGSFRRAKYLNLRIGDRVKVLYDIIPYLTFDEDCEHMGGKKVEMPDECPECGSSLVISENGGTAECQNPECPCRIKGKILNYLNKMRIDGISYGIIDKLHAEGYMDTIKDIYRIEKNAKRIMEIDGFGYKLVNSWVHEIDAHREVEDYIMLGALGITGTSTKTFEKVCSLYNLDVILEIIENKELGKLMKVPSVKEKTASKILYGLRENKKLIEFLEKELTIIETKGQSGSSNLNVCFTKVRDSELEGVIKSAGGKVVDSVTKSTNILVVPSLSETSTKISKAKNLGIQIMSISEAREYFNSLANKP